MSDCSPTRIWLYERDHGGETFKGVSVKCASCIRSALEVDCSGSSQFVRAMVVLMREADEEDR